MNHTKHLISELERLEVEDRYSDIIGDAFVDGQELVIQKVKNIISKHLHHNEDEL
jgi:hypothetical protein